MALPLFPSCNSLWIKSAAKYINVNIYILIALVCKALTLGSFLVLLHKQFMYILKNQKVKLHSIILSSTSVQMQNSCAGAAGVRLVIGCCSTQMCDFQTCDWLLLESTTRKAFKRSIQKHVCECVCSILTAVCVHLDGLNAEHKFQVWDTILDHTSRPFLYTRKQQKKISKNQRQLFDKEI